MATDKEDITNLMLFLVISAGNTIYNSQGGNISFSTLSNRATNVDDVSSQKVLTSFERA